VGVGGEVMVVAVLGWLHTKAKATLAATKGNMEAAMRHPHPFAAKGMSGCRGALCVLWGSARRMPL